MKNYWSLDIDLALRLPNGLRAMRCAQSLEVILKVILTLRKVYPDYKYFYMCLKPLVPEVHRN
jgi:hypothetical protein